MLPCSSPCQGPCFPWTLASPGTVPPPGTPASPGAVSPSRPGSSPRLPYLIPDGWPGGCHDAWTGPSVLAPQAPSPHHIPDEDS